MKYNPDAPITTIPRLIAYLEHLQAKAFEENAEGGSNYIDGRLVAYGTVLHRLRRDNNLYKDRDAHRNRGGAS